MKRLILLVLYLGMAVMATGEVSTNVHLADGNTPLPPVDPNFPHVYPDIMVGTRLAIIVYSDLAEEWWGGLFIPDEDKDYGILSGAFCLPGAGEGAEALPWDDEYIHGFDLYTGFTGIEAGDWFIVDYNAIDIGPCKVEFYQGLEHDPNHDLYFTHVRTRDFNKDTKVDFIDFTVLASYWQVGGCNDPNWCEGTDLDTDGDVDPNDLKLFVDYWLKKTE